VIDRLGEHGRAFVAAPPFAVLATSGSRETLY
jgi:hypothetical protein